MKFKTEHYFNWPSEKIIELLKAGESLCDMEELPNVNTHKILEERREGTKIFKRYEWCVHGQIPPVAQKILKPEMLTFVEDTVWDDESCSFTVKIIPHFFSNIVSCKSVSKWTSAGENRTKREVNGILNVKLPIIGPIIEQTIVNYFKKNSDKNAEAIKKNLTSKLGAPKGR